MKTFAGLIATYALITLACSASVLGAPHPKPTPPSIPSQPSAPSQILAPKKVEYSFSCDRKILHQGKVLNCDSYLGYDGENLRPFMQDIPPAASELDRYQRDRHDVMALAYIGSLGILSMILANKVSEEWHSAITAQTIKHGMLYGGGGLTLGALSIGMYTLRHNENHLEQSIQRYNEARPNDPIELQFSTGVNF